MVNKTKSGLQNPKSSFLHLSVLRSGGDQNINSTVQNDPEGLFLGG